MNLISVNDELPTINEIVLATIEGYVGVAYYDGKDWYGATDNKKIYQPWWSKRTLKVTHWIKLS